MLCVPVYLYFYNNKVVEGSGSEGTPKCVGEGVTYGVFLGIVTFCMCVPSDAPHQLALTFAYVVMT